MRVSTRIAVSVAILSVSIGSAKIGAAQVSVQATAAPPSAYAAIHSPALKPLPALPLKPSNAISAAPACQGDYLKQQKKTNQATAIKFCIADLDAHFKSQLAPFAAAMQKYRDDLASLYLGIRTNADYRNVQRKQFYEQVTAALDEVDPNGAYTAPYRAQESIYRARRALLMQTFCTLVTCTVGAQ